MKDVSMSNEPNRPNQGTPAPLPNDAGAPDHVLDSNPSLDSIVVQACATGWDEQSCVLDVPAAAKAANQAIQQLPWQKRYDAGSRIYAARKRQLSTAIESALMTPSYRGSKLLHETFMRWIDLLNTLPSLNARLLTGEVTLVGNLCKRSKTSVMPGDRLVYTAYATLNDKEDYGTTFARALAPRISFEQQQELKMLQLAEEHLAAYDRLADAHCEDEGLALASKLAEDRDALLGMTGASIWMKQISELEELRLACKPYEVSKKRRIDRSLRETRDKLARLYADSNDAIVRLEHRLKTYDLSGDLQ